MVSQSAALVNIIAEAKERAKNLNRKNDALFGFVAALQGCEDGNEQHESIRVLLKKKISHYSEDEIKNAEVSSIILCGELCLRDEQGAVKQYFMIKYSSLGSPQLAKSATVAAGVAAVEDAVESGLEEIMPDDAGGSSAGLSEEEKSSMPNMSSLLTDALDETDKAAQSAKYAAAIKRVSPRIQAKVSAITSVSSLLTCA